TLLFSNGGPVHPPFIRTDHVHQVAPCYYEEALRAGEPAAKHHFVPYGIDMIAAPSAVSIEAHRSVRQKRGLPLDRKIILSVGWVRRLHKRMDYVIEEVARLPWPRPFLQILGAMDEGSAEIIALGERLLGKNGFGARSVSHSKLFEYYQAADCFVLASIGEGFGRVYLEALMHGLPVIAHRNPVTQFVLGPHGILDDLGVPGVLEGLLNAELSKQPELNVARSRWQTVRDRFSWPVLAPGYRSMFHACAVESGYVEPSVAGTHFATW
ncbi:MAG TPA: glycosyltransferase family 4 protein, partial [Patescibacteria group bacterium]|nr:glycosyltransferase family 4 protein [Patescibacteria group bacterium]